MVRTSRRAFLGGMGGSAMAVGWPARAQNPSSITVTSFGGVWETSIREVVVPESETNEHQGERAARRAAAVDGSDRSESGEAPIDILVNVPDLALVAGRSGLVEKVSASARPISPTCP